MKLNKFKHCYKKTVLILWSFFSVFFFYSHDVLAVTDSTAYFSPLQPNTTGAAVTSMVFGSITATIVARVNNSTSWLSGCNAFPFVAQCPPGSVPNSVNDEISATDLTTCYNSDANPAVCKPSIRPNGIGWSAGCNGSYKTTWSLTTEVRCNLSLQGWIPVSNITPLLTSGQRAAPTNNFYLGTYTVSYNANNNYYVANSCVITLTPPSSGVTQPATIPSYPPLCPVSYKPLFFAT